jgi:hypothetical protein
MLNPILEIILNALLNELLEMVLDMFGMLELFEMMHMMLLGLRCLGWYYEFVGWCIGVEFPALFSCLVFMSDCQ